MTTIFNKFKSFAIVVMVLSFTLGITLNSCTSDKKKENTEKVEAASEAEEHPSGGEHPEGEEHPAGEEHPSSEEHPAGDEHEHPSDSTEHE